MIEAYLPRGAWTFDYFTSGATTPLARQIVRTRARALTQSEANASPHVSLDSAYMLTTGNVTSLRSRALPQGSPATPFLYPLEGLKSLSYAWERELAAKEPPLPLVATRVFGFVNDFSSAPSKIRDFSQTVVPTLAIQQATVSCSVKPGIFYCDSDGN